MKLLKDNIVKKFVPAFHGLLYSLKDTSILLQYLLGIIAIILGFIFRLSAFEWIIIIILIGLVIAVEVINSCIERVCDAIYPSSHNNAKVIKDMAAFSVLVVSIIALIIAIIIFGGKL